ncbi:probable sarcosine oxidase [Punica granatum]|uniref:FAD dependent oxidoreductase domain-containing protein n=2 Tax=Punica granatum TaxID=22663 RepID=A0A218WX40_PUNGR|nr:probable sarcosine oxidase [Punica granatum]OWM77274.1 hypothetical protein CDL15_Pgr028911 [Punica granatum]PKI51843.1 hypothetical protein CRG98_027761 [Punica granatum]
MDSCSGSRIFDLIVVGGGVMGSSTAYQSAKRGYRTLLLEQFDFLHHRGSSHGESRTIRATYPEHYYSKMVMEAWRLWEEAESDAGFRVYTKTSQLDVGPADNKSLKAVASSCQKNSLPHLILNHEQLALKFSSRVSIPENWVAVSTELGGVIRPTKAVSMFQTLAFQKGALLRDNVEVIDIRRDEVRGGVRVYTSNGEEFLGRKCVVTAGAWAKKLVQKVCGLELPIQAVETPVSYWRIKPGHEEKYSIGGVDSFPTFASYGNPYIYGTPCLEFPGLIKIAIHGGCPCDPDNRPWRQGFQLDALKEWIDKRFQGIVDSSGSVLNQSCMYSMTPDEDFVIDFLGREFGQDVVVGGGFSGHGFKMAPIVGRMLVDLAFTGKTEGVELKYFKIGRFQENPKGNAKDYEDQVSFSLNPDGQLGCME